MNVEEKLHDHRIIRKWLFRFEEYDYQGTDFCLLKEIGGPFEEIECYDFVHYEGGRTHQGGGGQTMTFTDEVHKI